MRQPNLPAGNAARSDAREAVLRAAAAGEGAARRRIIAILDAASRDWRHAPSAIDRGLRGARELSSAQRRFVADTVHEIIRFRRRLVAAAGDESPAALLDVWLAHGRQAGADRVAAITDPVARLALRCSWPDWLVTRIVAERGLDESRALLEAMNRRAPLVIRANGIKGTREELAARLALLGIRSRPTPLAASGLLLETRSNIQALAPFRDGAMEAQDEGSQLVAEVVAPPPRAAVIDACAGAGGKTLALGAALANRGRLVACDVDERKLVELRKRARRAGLTNVHAVAAAASGPPTGMPDAARVLVDAPCSSTGVVRRSPEIKWSLESADLDALPAQQRAILDAYAPRVAVGGRLIYATCSIMAGENEGVVASFLDAHVEFELFPLKEILGRERASAVGDGNVLRLLPHVHDTDAFFAAVLRRRR